MYAKRTISPISLRRVIQTARFAEMTRAFTRDQLAEFLGTSAGLAGRIARETFRAGLIDSVEDRYFTTPECSQFLQIFRTSGPASVHEAMMRHPVYAALIDLLRSASYVSLDDESMDEQQLEAFPFHGADRHMACSWAEEIGSVQQNFFTGQYYRVGNLREQFIPTFLRLYRQLEIPAGPVDKRKPVPVRILREFVCQRMHIARSDFDSKIRDLCGERPEEFQPSHPAGSRYRHIRWKPRRWCNRTVRSPEYFSGNISPECIEINGRMYRFILWNDR